MTQGHHRDSHCVPRQPSQGRGRPRSPGCCCHRVPACPRPGSRAAGSRSPSTGMAVPPSSAGAPTRAAPIPRVFIAPDSSPVQQDNSRRHRNPAPDEPAAPLALGRGYPGTPVRDRGPCGAGGPWCHQAAPTGRAVGLGSAGRARSVPRAPRQTPAPCSRAVTWQRAWQPSCWPPAQIMSLGMGPHP